MKTKAITNSRKDLISSDLVIKHYLLGFNLASKLKSKVSSSELIHRSLIFLYLAQLVATRDNNLNPAILKKYYIFLTSIFDADVIDFDDQFFSSEAIGNNYPFNQMGYVIDISHQFYLSSISSEESSATEFSSPSGYRKMRGAFYTPYDIASLIVSKTLEELVRNKIKKPKILDMGWNADGTKLISGSADSSIRIWNFSA